MSVGGLHGERIRVRGTVQGVGFRPTVWRIASRLGLRGQVANDGDGVLIDVWGEPEALHEFVASLRSEAPPLARIGTIERERSTSGAAPGDFRIAGTVDKPGATLRTEVAPDAATCAACLEEVFDPLARRHRYPFTNCTHCGPRLSVITAMPYDRAATTMAAFPLCGECAAEYEDPGDRRFHAEPIGCHSCGPRAKLVRSDGGAFALESVTSLDEVDAACTLLQQGQVVAIQGLGGYQLACDATRPEVVARLRASKRRERRPFALMARDLEMVRQYCRISDAEAALLSGAAAPIVLLERHAGEADAGAAALAAGVAPGLGLLGFMLPSTPLHHLLLRRMPRPIVLTSGNLSDEPQAHLPDDARARLASLADYFLEHDRPIARRVDDSVTRVVLGRPRVLRRARGHAPASLPLPPGFERAPDLLAYGGELKNTFCLLSQGQATLSAHIGELHEPLARADFARALADFRGFLRHQPEALACDLHPDYGSTRLAQAEADRGGLPLLRCQHHHAHLAACLAENGVALDAPPLLGVALDGIGLGDDGILWGGELLRFDYAGYQRLGTFKPVALLGGDAAAREPWRNTYAHLMAGMGWPAFAMNHDGLELHRFLAAQPRELLDGMLKRGLNAPLASSCGRLFDAVAAAVGICREQAHYEGQGAIELEAAVDLDCLHDEDEALGYPFALPRLKSGLSCVEPLPMWQALLGDLQRHTPVGVMAARFHRGLGHVIVTLVERLAGQVGGEETPLRRVALSGGVFQNRILFERVVGGLEARGFAVLTHASVPCNDGGLSLGQAAIAAARLLQQQEGE